MREFYKQHKQVILIAILIIILSIVTTLYYHNQHKLDQTMRSEFVRIFQIPAPTTPEEKTKIQTQIRLKLIELRLKQTLATTENYSTEFPTLINFLHLNTETLHSSAEQSTKNFYQARNTAQYFGYTFIETTPTADLIKEYLKQSLLPN